MKNTVLKTSSPLSIVVLSGLALGQGYSIALE
ncbi:MAG: hypothetical protein KatS3mg072_2522 [Meiothermus sp.]|nr:MAG: hypothetical protein KatS3mg072_2522 [Meiothermus sp.]